MGAIETFRDALFGNPPSSTTEPSREGTLAAFTELYNASVIALYATQAGITTVATIALRDTFYATVENRGKLVYVNNNNGVADDPANGVYEYVSGAARLAEGFYAGVATIVQPLVDEASDLADAAAASEAGAEASRLANEEALAPLKTYQPTEATVVTGEYYNSNTGAIGTNGNYRRIEVSVLPGEVIKATGTVPDSTIGNGRALVVWFDISHTFIAASSFPAGVSTVTYTDEPVTVPAGAYFAGVTSYYPTSNTPPSVKQLQIDPLLTPESIQGIADAATVPILHSFYDADPNAIVLYDFYYLRTNGVLTANVGYRALEPIAVTPGETVYITTTVGTSSIALAVWLDGSDAYISSYMNGSGGVNTEYDREPVVVPAGAAKLLVCSRWLYSATDPKVERFGIDPALATVPARTSALELNVLAGTIRKLLGAAQRPLGDLSTVMSSPPTITGPVTDGANSTVISGSTVAVGGGVFNSENPVHVTRLGGNSLASDGRIQTITRTAVEFLQGHSAGIAFSTMAATVDFCIRAGPTRQWVAYVTDMLTGVRARISAADQAPPIDGFNYYKLAFGSRALRRIEVYGHRQGAFRGINVPAGDSVWPAVMPEPKIAMLGDSWFVGAMNETPTALYQLKLALPDFFAAELGIQNPLVNAITGTGVLADSGAGYYTFGQRVAAGDFAVSKVGYLDMICPPGSINDADAAAGGIAIGTPDTAGVAAVTAGYQADIAALMVEQPSAVIIGWSQQFLSSGAANSGRAAAYKAGFLAAARNEPRMIWMDNTLYQSAPDTGALGADGSHPGGVDGGRYIGKRLAQQVIQALQDRLQTILEAIA